MKKTTSILWITFFSSAIVISTQSCQKDEDMDPMPQEFIASNSTFTGFMSWSLDAVNQGPDPALGGVAHGGNDSTVTRNVYFKDGQDPVNGTYPLGTVIVKHSNNPSGTVNEFTAMVKRGNDFNPNVGDWEFFILDPNGNIAQDSTGNPLRGADLMNGACGNCHSFAASSDFVFSK